MPTFLRWWNPDNIVGKRCSFPHAVSNVPHSAIFLDVGMGCHAVNIDKIAQIDLCRNDHIPCLRFISTSFDFVVYLLQCLQSLSVDFGNVVSLRYGVIVLSHGIDIHQAVVCDLNTFEVGEKPANKKILLH